MRNFIRTLLKVLIPAITLLLLCLMLPAPAALAQDGEVFVSPDEDWQVMLLDGYEIDVDRDNVATITGDQVELTLYSPAVLEDMGYRRIKDGESLLEDFADEESYDFKPLDSPDSFPGMFIGTYENRRDAYLAIAKTFSDDSFGLVLASVDADAEDQAYTDILDISVTFDVAGTEVPELTDNNGNGGTKEPDNNNVSGELPDELNDFDSEWEDAVAELEDDGVIPSGGALVYFEDYAFISGQGTIYTTLARKASVENLVIAGELTFEPDGRDFQTCSLAARVEVKSNGDTSIYTEFGVDTDDELFVYDWFGEGKDDYSSYRVQDLDASDVHHYLVLMVDDKMAIYLDGELVANDLAVEPRNGSFGVLIRGDGTDSRCEVRNTWAYSIPSASDVCEATATGDINKRSGPGTSFDKDGTLKGGKSKEVIAFADGDDNFTWYELKDESWVREDLITLSGPCDDLPEEN
jgi:hypothetical protein